MWWPEKIDCDGSGLLDPVPGRSLGCHTKFSSAERGSKSSSSAGTVCHQLILASLWIQKISPVPSNRTPLLKMELWRWWQQFFQRQQHEVEKAFNPR